ncbi:MAG: carboxypeptidase-like regulatory domain-containing protein [Dysgonamonadaceae bacterium]|jgi:hypothetical protein|nr:carboxypeptidase-like regulatory domain-containing protein [Dysgonamonadaceae bacterium]
MNLIQYIQGNRKGKDAHRLEKEAMHDLFLADALDGYNKIPGNHSKPIEKLRQTVSRKSHSRKNKQVLLWNMAASILVIFTIGMGIGIYRLSTPAGHLEMAELPADMRPEMKEPKPADRLVPVPAEKAAKKPANPALTVQAEEKIVQENIEIIEPEAVKELAVPATIMPEQLEISPLAENQITGKVVDETGEPIIGASVLLSGTNQGTVTDSNGNFVLPVNNNDPISVNFLGYEPVTLPADKNKSMLIAMNENHQTLSEVIVVGYGTQKKSSVTPAVSTIFSKKEVFDDYVKRELVSPADEECKNAKGAVTLAFHVNENGRPYNITVKKSLCPSADKEAIRLLEAGPDWPLTEKEITKKIRFKK